MDATVTGCSQITTANNTVCLVTYQGGISRRGFNPNETLLTQAKVQAGTRVTGTPNSANLWAFDAKTLSCLATTDAVAAGVDCVGGVTITGVPAGLPIKFTVPAVANGWVIYGTAEVDPATSRLNIFRTQ